MANGMTQRPLFGEKHLYTPPAKFKLPPRPWLTIDEVAEYLRVTPETVRDWISSGELRAFKRKQTVRIAKQSLRMFVRHHWSDKGDYDAFKERRAAIARIKAIIRQNLPADLDKETREGLVSTVYNAIKDDIREFGLHL